MVVGVLLAFDVGIMTTWQTTDPFYRETKNMDAYVSMSRYLIELLGLNRE